MKAVIYCRVSSKEQVDNFSLPTQEAACRDYCRRNEWSVTEVFIERGESAKTADRTEFQKLLNYCRSHKGRVDYVVVYNLSRFARNQYDHHVVRSLLQTLGITLRSVTEPIDDGVTGHLMEGIMAAFHEFDNALRRERAIAGMKAAVGAGKWCWGPPTGFDVTDGLLTPNDDAPKVRHAFELVASGYSIADAYREARRMGLPMTRSGFYAMLRRSAYAGWIESRSQGLKSLGRHNPIVDQRTFDRVQLALSGEATVYQIDNPDFPLRRFVRCALCDGVYTAGWSKGRHQRYGYYRCVKCPRTSVRAHELEAQFAELLLRVQPSAEYLALFRRAVTDRLNQRERTAREIAQKARAAVEEVDKRRERLVEAYIYDRAIDRPTYEAQLDKLNEQLALARLRAQDAEVEQIDAEGILGFAEHLAANASRLWVEFNLRQKQRFQAFIFPDGAKYAGGAFLNPRTSLLFNEIAEEPMLLVGNGRGERI
jgi:site-specific DNA recombinase